jgi:signal transduction histidine kinase
VTHNAAVFVNGIWIGQGGRFEEPVSRHHNNPLMFEFSSELLHHEPSGLVENRIDIRVMASHARQGLMDQFYLAPATELRAAYEWKRFWRVDFIQWITMAMYFMGGIVLCFWLARPQDKIYGLFALQLFIWATHNLNLFVFDIPSSAHFWEAMTMSTLGWTVVAMILFNHRYVGGGNVRVEKLVLIFGICGLGIFLLPEVGDVLRIGYGVWDSFLIIFGSYAILHLLKVFWRLQDIDVYLMLLVGVPILVFGLHDILTVNYLRDRRDGLTIQYSVIPAIMLFSFFLVRRFVQSINQAEELSATLEQRVIEKQREVESQFEKLKSMEQERVLSKERERIMRDMHDGIGG